MNASASHSVPENPVAGAPGSVAAAAAGRKQLGDTIARTIFDMSGDWPSHSQMHALAREFEGTFGCGDCLDWKHAFSIALADASGIEGDFDAPSSSVRPIRSTTYQAAAREIGRMAAQLDRRAAASTSQECAALTSVIHRLATYTKKLSHRHRMSDRGATAGRNS